MHRSFQRIFLILTAFIAIGGIATAQTGGFGPTALGDTNGPNASLLIDDVVASTVALNHCITIQVPDDFKLTINSGANTIPR